MKKTIIYSLFNEKTITESLAQSLNTDIGDLVCKEFPDGELYLQVKDRIKDKSVIVVASLDYPNDKIAKLLLFSETLRQEGATQVGLVAPYLCYMRQDKQFHEGESITSEIFAKFISNHFDWLVTVDPHLHRHKTMSEIYTIPTQVVHASKQISNWILSNVKDPILIGPDMESEQWVSQVAKEAKAQHMILEKVRHGDRDVEVSLPDKSLLSEKTPVLVDDIISTASTMIKTVHHLSALKADYPVCIGVHAIFAQDAYEELLYTGVETIVTCNTVEHKSNDIDLSEDIAVAVKDICKRR